MGDTNAVDKTAQSYDLYDEYSKNEYYQGALTTKRPYFTDPYFDQGVTMVTASYPLYSR